jgi:hypothetical protein
MMFLPEPARGMEPDDSSGGLVREVELSIFEIDVNQRPAWIDGRPPYVASAFLIAVIGAIGPYRA